MARARMKPPGADRSPSDGISAAQLKAIYALGRKAGMDNDDIHALAQNMAGCNGRSAPASLKQLNRAGASRLISELKRRTGQELPPPPPPPPSRQALDRATYKQQGAIRAIAHDMGWDANPRRLRGWLEKQYGVSDARFLSPRQASACIAALRAIMRGGYGGERDGGSAPDRQ